MVIDSQEHIMFPIKMQLEKMDAAGVDKTVLFCTAPHPEKAGTLNELEEEMAALNKILAGSNTKEDNISRLKKNITEVTEAVSAYPDRFLGFGAVPFGMELEETENGSTHRSHPILCMGLENLPPAVNSRSCSWKQSSGH